MIHPCDCTEYNGGQCYNCLNGYHVGCTTICLGEKGRNLRLALEINMDWVRAALDCKNWQWDVDQRAAAESSYLEGEIALGRKTKEKSSG